MVHSGYHPLKHRPLRIALGGLELIMWSVMVLALVSDVKWGNTLSKLPVVEIWIVPSGL